MLYFLKQTFNMHESHIHSFLTHFPFICYNGANFWPVPISRANGFITLPPLTLTSFKTIDVTLKYARFLKIGNVALYQERTILNVSKFQYTQCIGSRPVKLKPISRGVSFEWYTIFVAYNFWKRCFLKTSVSNGIIYTKYTQNPHTIEPPFNIATQSAT